MVSINDSQPAGPGRAVTHEPAAPTWDARAGGDTPYSAAHNLLEAVVQEHGKYLERIAPLEQDYTSDGFDRQRKAFATTSAAGRVDEAQRIAQQRTAKAVDDLDTAVLSSVSQPRTPEAESRAIRITNRAERVLAATDSDIHGTVRKLIHDAPDPETRGVLAQELPTIAGVTPDYIRDVLVESNPVAAARAKDLLKAQAAQALIDADAKRVKNAIAEGHLPYVPLTDVSRYDIDAGR
jgi:hypothetical protein